MTLRTEFYHRVEVRTFNYPGSGLLGLFPPVNLSNEGSLYVRTSLAQAA
jgi:hypothetical protein